ncbi:MotE family protein [Hyphomicrobium sp.]|uniref:MotE family protein n=1 Tax=Hyphomicrobium sp. TaxID=82 RepID=UPI003569803E
MRAGLRIVLSSGLMLVVVDAATAESGQRPMVGPPVDRSARTFDLRPNADEHTPIPFSFRIAVDESKHEPANKADDKDPEALPLPPTPKEELSPAQQYCSSIIEATSAAQIAQQTRNLQKAQKEIDDRIALLTAKAQVLKSWMKLREEFVARATASLVQIYGRMKPDSAAAQLAAMDEMTSAAIISKLAPKVSSPIMAEMDVAKAARLSAVIAGAGELAVQSERKADAQQ